MVAENYRARLFVLPLYNLGFHGQTEQLRECPVPVVAEFAVIVGKDVNVRGAFPQGSVRAVRPSVQCDARGFDAGMHPGDGLRTGGILEEEEVEVIDLRLEITVKSARLEFSAEERDCQPVGTCAGLHLVEASAGKEASRA